ncbi:MAG: hypothetical protein NC092_06365 [Butyrivibrio sp.]|nr:hypothetical protein [Muribaculum sp.]MCM1552299.1 hypothetical protein [Butyrivibrio sp.]
MEITECFLILGIEPTKDEGLIKNAYREKLAVTNPEDDPEGFKRLRAAYEEACVYARRGDDKDTPAERDTTPSGLWVERAGEIYANIKTRQQGELWQELFDDEIFQALEEEENCRLKLLRYLMDHFRLPTEIWKLLNEKMNLVGDAGRLRESFPVEFINFVVNRCERGEDIEFDLFEGAEDAEYDLFINYYDNCWQALQEENLSEAERLLDEAAGLHIYHPAMEVCRGSLLYAQGKKEEAASFMRALRDKYPKDAMVCYNTAETLWKLGKRDESAEIYLGLKAENEKHYMANVRLVEWYYDNGKYIDAKKCAEAVLSAGADDEFMELLTKVNSKLERDMELKWRTEKDWESGLELCWCYLQDGKNSKGLRLAREIEELITPERKAEYHGLLAKLLVEMADYAAALEMSQRWEKLLEEKLLTDETEEEKEKDQDRIRQAHMIRMQCHKSIGYTQKEHFNAAIKEIEAVETGTPRDIGFWLEKAQIYLELEEYEKSLELTSRMIEEYQVYAAAATAMEVYRRQWEAGGVVQNARLCIQTFPNYVRAYDHLGRVYLDLGETEALKELLAEAEKNKIESPYLEAYRYQMKQKPPEVEVLNERLDEFQQNFQNKLYDGETAYFETGLPIITEYLYWYPGPYMLRRRAAFYRSGMQLEKALEDYEKALLDEPANPYIHDAMGRIYMVQGNFEQALISNRKALLYGGKEWYAVSDFQMAKLYMLLGDNEEALYWFRKCEKLGSDEVAYQKSMAVCLGRLGKTEEAIQKLHAYYGKKDGTFYDGYYRSLWELFDTVGETDRALKLLDKWQGELQVVKSKWNFLIPKSTREKKSNESAVDYYSCAGWQALMEGDGKRALESLEQQVKCGEAVSKGESDDGLADMIFAAILYGDEEKGKKYSEKLKLYLNKSSLKAADEFHERPKMKLMAQLLANYYRFSDEQLQELLDSEKDCALCSFCQMPLCQELEGVRILLLIRQGKLDEAKERAARNLEIHPDDQYMRAIQAFWQKRNI